jgi:hypothetical protein
MPDSDALVMGLAKEVHEHSRYFRCSSSLFGLSLMINRSRTEQFKNPTQTASIVAKISDSIESIESGEFAEELSAAKRIRGGQALTELFEFAVYHHSDEFKNKDDAKKNDDTVNSENLGARIHKTPCIILPEHLPNGVTQEQVDEFIQHVGGVKAGVNTIPLPAELLSKIDDLNKESGDIDYCHKDLEKLRVNIAHEIGHSALHNYYPDLDNEENVKLFTKELLHTRKHYILRFKKFGST